MIDSFIIMQVGVLIGQDDPTLDILSFGCLEDVRILLNLKYDINIVKGMPWNEVLAILSKAIEDRNANREN
jgi:uncharacterized protein YuzB (UPF0349 family)